MNRTLEGTPSLPKVSKAGRMSPPTYTTPCNETTYHANDPQNDRYAGRFTQRNEPQLQD